MKALEILKRFFRDERGLETVEYAVLAGLIAAGLIVTLGYLRDEIIAVFNRLITAIKPT